MPSRSQESDEIGHQPSLPFPEDEQTQAEYARLCRDMRNAFGVLAVVGTAIAFNKDPSGIALAALGVGGALAAEESRRPTRSIKLD